MEIHSRYAQRDTVVLVLSGYYFTFLDQPNVEIGSVFDEMQTEMFNKKYCLQH